MSTRKEIIHTTQAPAPIGPYNQAIRAGNTLYISGQIALSPQTGELVGGSVAEEARQVLDNLGAVLSETGYTFTDVVKTTIFVRDMNDFAAGKGNRGSSWTTEKRKRRNFRHRLESLNARALEMLRGSFFCRRTSGLHVHAVAGH